MPPPDAGSTAREEGPSGGRHCRDQYGTGYYMPLMPYEGVDFSRKCFVFPGQHAARPGMGKDDLRRFEILRQRFGTADALAAARGLPAPSLFAEDPSRIPPEHMPLLQALALFTMSVGLFELVLVHNERPALVTGHSFGEFAALAASGISGFEDMFDIVHARDRASPPAGAAGAMIVVAADAQTARRALGTIPATVATINSPRQTVFSVASGAMKEALAALKREKLAARVLDVPQPYHSPLMAEAAARLAQHIESKDIVFHPPRTPMLSSVLGRVIRAENFSSFNVKELLAKQLTAPVDFVSQIHTAAALGCRHFIELAHDSVSAPWIGDILEKDAWKVSVPPVLRPPPTDAAAPKPARAYDSKLVGFLNRVIASVTGYSIEEISLANNFQDDLGIDSIKKVQIVFDFLEGQGDFSIDVQDNAVMRQIRTVEDVLAWYLKDRKDGGVVPAGANPFIRSRPEWAEQPVTVADRLLAARAGAYAWVGLSAAGRLLSEALSSEGGVIFYDDGEAFVFEDFLAAVQAAGAALAQKTPAFELALVTQDGSPPEVQALDGFLKSMARETGLVFRAIRFDHLSMERDRIAAEQEMGLPFVRSVRFAGGMRQVQKMTPRPEITAPVPTPEVVAAIGGSRGITLEILKNLAAAGTKSIYIIGRAAAESVEEGLAALRSLGAEVFYQSGDATVAATLAQFLARPVKEKGAIDLLIHGGGMELSAPLAQQSPAAARVQCAIKIGTTRHLIELCRAQPIRRVICFSSTAGELGNAGQTVYAYANMAMTYLCEASHREGLAFQSIAWPGWDRVGMTENENAYRQLRLEGWSLLDIPSGCRLFGEALADKDAAHIICGAAGSIRDPLLPQALQAVFPGLAAPGSPIHLGHWTLEGFPDLRDHVILGHLVIPIALCLTTFFYLGFFETGRVCRLAEIKMSSFMPLHPKDSPYFLDYRRDGDILRAEIRSNERHIEATIVPCEPAEPPAASFAEPSVTTPIDCGTVDYEDSRQRFQVCRNTRWDAKNRVYADLDCRQQRIRLGTGPVHLMTLVIEAMLQMGGAGIRVLTGRNSIPFAMKSLAVNAGAEPSQAFKIVAQCMPLSADIASNELRAYNGANQPFIRIDGEQVRTWITHET